MKKYLKKHLKRTIGDYYFYIMDDPKNYESITRYKMVDEINDFINDNLYIINRLFTIDEFKKFKDIAEIVFKEGYFKAIANPDKLSLKELFLYENIEEKDGFFYYYLSDTIVEYLRNYKFSKEDEQYDYFFYFVCGLIETYGVIEFYDVDEIYEMHRPQRFEKLEQLSIFSEPYLRLMIMDRGYITYNDFFTHYLVFSVDLYDLPDIYATYDGDYYYEFGYYGMDKQISDLLELDNREDILEQAKNYQLFVNDYFSKGRFIMNPEHYFSLLEENVFVGALNWPVWVYGGKTAIMEMKEEMESILPLDVAEAFNDFLFSFVIFINKKYKFVPIRRKYNQNDLYAVLEEAVKNKDVFDEYANSNEFIRNTLNLEFIQAFKDCVVIDKGYAFDYEEGKLLVFSGDYVYAVSGLTHSIRDNIPENMLPTLVNVILLPIRGHITYPYAMSNMSISLGEGVIKIFEEDLEKAIYIFDEEDYYMHNPHIKQLLH